MIRVLLVVLVLFSMTADVDAKKHHKKHKQTYEMVFDGASPQWQSAILETIADFNRIMPERGPKLVYQRTTCEMTTCSGDRPEPYVATAFFDTRLIIMEDRDFPEWERERIVCHEFMHILTGIQDNYHSRTDSCVWGDLSDPGPFDKAMLERFYG